jgi:hypothetical protein
MKRRLIMYAFLPVVGISLLGAGVASAHGFGFGGFGGFGMGPTLSADEIATRQQSEFDNQAALLGISVDDIKAGWAEGKSLDEIATAHGITKDQLAQKMKDARTAQMKTQLQALVVKGVITQAQADSRLTAMANMKVRMGKGGMPRGPMMKGAVTTPAI